MGIKRGSIAKAFEITNANISFVSLVNKAANKKQFLITKAEEGKAAFRTYGKILKTDTEAHYVTGIVYEPMVEDTQGNYMTEAEIIKAAYSYAKNGMNADLQHNFVAMEGAAVVESYVAKCDEVINGQEVRKGTWIMTMEITDPEIFASIQKGDITGFSMGGVGQYSTEDVSLEEPVQKGGAFKQIAKRLGLGAIEKGAVKDSYFSRITSEAFWEAFYALQDVLLRWNYYADKREFEHDPEVIREALADFNEIVTDILTQPAAEAVAKSVDGIVKAGRVMSAANKETLKSIHESLGEFLEKLKDNEEEEIEVTKSEIQEIVKSAVAECMGTPAAQVSQETGDPEDITKQDIQEIVKQAIAGATNPQSAQPPTDEKITKAVVQEMIDSAIRKATGEEEPAQESGGVDMGEAITKAVAAAMEPFMKQAGLPTNLNNTNVQKAEEELHYMHGFI